jgi:hypothetical protein
MESNAETIPHFRTMILVCKDCGCDWQLTDMEQQAMYRKGLAMPKRCPECRQTRRQHQVTSGQGGDLK